MIGINKVTLPLLLLLPLEGLCNWMGNLHSSTEGLTWNAAKEYCTAKGADLITMRDDADQYMNVEGWVDLHRDSASSVWMWYRRSIKAKNLTWENSVQLPGEACAYHESGEKGLRSSLCNVKRSFTCKKVYLLLVRENKTWEEALNHCRALEVKNPSQPIEFHRNFRFDLATILPDVHSFAQRIAQRATTDEVWTGLRYLAGYWLWIGKGNVAYKNIEKCPSKGFCGTLPKAAGKLYGIRHCDEKRNFFCYRWEG
ncbi:lymphocyte antigen 75-like [Halichoeres trimaculatus]|uniref:lymphocyte antigen 75-like n=1 Tax=Halichoeres trimaculatus TaxID=147232 RepID=UPI003D9EB216